MSRVAEWLKSAGLGQFCSDFNNIDEDGFLALQVRLVDPQLVFLRFSASSRAVLGTGYVEQSSKPECTCSTNFMRRRRPQRVSCTWSSPLSVTTRPIFYLVLQRSTEQMNAVGGRTRRHLCARVLANNSCVCVYAGYVCNAYRCKITPTTRS